MKKIIYCFFIILIFSIPILFPLFKPGFYQSDDGEWMVIRFSAFHQALRDGQFPVRFLPRLNYGYGYPVANFLYPGFMYLAEPIKIAGFGYVDTIKIIIGLSLFTSSLFTFLWLSKRFDVLGSLFGAFLYLYAPYHGYDTYVRGSVGELLALSVLPFTLWSVDRRSLFWTSIGIGLLILSHNTLALLFLPLIVIYIIIAHVKSLKFYFLSFSLGVGLSTFFWFPALHDLQYTVFSKTKISDPNAYFASFTLIGLVFVLLLLFLLVDMFMRYKSFKKLDNSLALFFGSILIISLVFSSSVSSPLWKLLPIQFIQFPFRFLALELIAVAFLFPFFLQYISKKARLVTAVVFSCIVFFFSYQYLTPKVFFDKGEGFYATNEDTTTVKNEYMPKWVEKAPNSHPKDVIEVSNATISNVSIQSNSIAYDIVPENYAEIQINRVYFPGWVMKRDDKTFYNFPLDINLKNGIFHYEWDKRYGKSEKYRYEIYFTEIPIRLLADVISVVCFIALFLISYKQKLWKL